MTKNIACPVCGGRGYTAWINTTDDNNSTGSQTCPHCDGTGIREVALTNADRIRAMTDEELYMWAKKQIGCGYDFFPCGVVCDGKCESYDDETCRAKILNWLKQPAED